MSENTTPVTPASEPPAADAPIVEAGTSEPVTSNIQPDVPATSSLDLDPIEPAPPVPADLGALDPTTPAPAAPAADFGSVPDAPSRDASGFDFGGGDYAESLARSGYGDPEPSAAAPTSAPLPSAEPPLPPPYQQPYPTQASYPAQVYTRQGVPGGLVQSEELTWGSAAHWSALVGDLVGLGFLGPLLVMLIQGPKSLWVRKQAVESLNFEITFIIAMIVSTILTIVVVGIIGLIAFPLVWLILRIVAAVATAKGQDYRYPLALRLVK